MEHYDVLPEAEDRWSELLENLSDEVEDLLYEIATQRGDKQIYTYDVEQAFRSVMESWLNERTVL